MKALVEYSDGAKHLKEDLAEFTALLNGPVLDVDAPWHLLAEEAQLADPNIVSITVEVDDQLKTLNAEPDRSGFGASLEVLASLLDRIEVREGGWR